MADQTAGAYQNDPRPGADAPKSAAQRLTPSTATVAATATATVTGT
ncbi:MAG: hypothetical protein HKN42_08620 [Granulosicoccus sp.]|nr:hypothetical protein [Granulosicoccus sp.]